MRRAGFAGDVIGVSPGAAYGSAKRWLPERFAEAAGRLARELDAGVAVFGSAAEREICAAVAAAAGSPAKSFAGETTLARFIEMAAACRAFLTNDSGAMHVAAALGVPTVAVFGPTDERATGPAGPLVKVVRHTVECSPCLKRDCPIDHRCMTRVPASSVAQAMLNLME
jgi:heptosyltransferase-2